MFFFLLDHSYVFVRDANPLAIKECGFLSCPEATQSRNFKLRNCLEQKLSRDDKLHSSYFCDAKMLKLFAG